jgi:UPF0716 protein FxsA
LAGGIAVVTNGRRSSAQEETVAFRLVIALFVMIWVAELALLLLLAESSSWKIALLLVLVTGLLGIAVIRQVRVRFGRRLLSTAHAGEPLGDVVIDGAILLLAGALLLLPGIISDVAGLLLLIPPVRWLILALWKRRYLPPRGRGDKQSEITRTALSEKLP